MAALKQPSILAELASTPDVVPVYAASQLGFDPYGRRGLDDFYAQLRARTNMFPLCPFAACSEYLDWDEFSHAETTAEVTALWKRFNKTLGQVNYEMLMPAAQGLVTLCTGTQIDDGVAAEMGFWAGKFQKPMHVIALDKRMVIDCSGQYIIQQSQGAIYRGIDQLIGSEPNKFQGFVPTGFSLKDLSGPNVLLEHQFGYNRQWFPQFKEEMQRFADAGIRPISTFEPTSGEFEVVNYGGYDIFHEMLPNILFDQVMPQVDAVVVYLDGSHACNDRTSMGIGYISGRHPDITIFGVRGDFRLAENVAAHINPAVRYHIDGRPGAKGKLFIGNEAYEQVVDAVCQAVKGD